MKISNETKVGALTLVAIVLLILGFNFLKGKSLFKTGNIIYAKYADAKGLMISNPVYINGFQAGNVQDIEEADKNLKEIIVAIKLKSDYNIPNNSTASISSNPLGTPSVEIQLGNSPTFIKTGEYITTSDNPGILGQLTTKLGPVADQVTVTVKTLDSVLKNINTILDPNAKGNLQGSIQNINKVTASLVITSSYLQKMLDQQSGALAQSLNNVSSFTKNLSDNNPKINQVIDNLNTTTNNLSKADIDGSVAQLKSAIQKLNNVIEKVGSNEGTLGLLMNDKTLYNNLNNTVRSANILVDDLRAHPKRYVNISVFGKKDKGNYLTAPLDSTEKK